MIPSVLGRVGGPGTLGWGENYMHDSELRLVHDLKNTATVIHAVAAEFQHGCEHLSSDTVQRFARMLSRRTEMLLRLIDDLALLQHLDEGDLDVELRPVALDDLLVESLPRQWRREGCQLTVDVEPGTVVHTDPTRLTQIIDNLVSNALRYGGPNIVIHGRPEGPWVHLHVEDDGPGVPAELAPRIFEPYVRGPDSDQQGGKGLGLTIVRGLCELLGGTVTYDTGERPCFTLRLPVPDQATPSSSRSGSMAK